MRRRRRRPRLSPSRCRLRALLSRLRTAAARWRPPQWAPRAAALRLRPSRARAPAGARRTRARRPSARACSRCGSWLQLLHVRALPNPNQLPCRPHCLSSAGCGGRRARRASTAATGRACADACRLPSVTGAAPRRVCLGLASGGLHAKAASWRKDAVDSCARYGFQRMGLGLTRGACGRAVGTDLAPAARAGGKPCSAAPTPVPCVQARWPRRGTRTAPLRARRLCRRSRRRRSASQRVRRRHCRRQRRSGQWPRNRRRA